MTITQQVLLDVVAPPVGASLWWLMSRGWAGAVQGSNVSETTRKRQRRLFWVVLGMLYLLMFGTTLYYSVYPTS